MCSSDLAGGTAAALGAADSIGSLFVEPIAKPPAEALSGCAPPAAVVEAGEGAGSAELAGAEFGSTGVREPICAGFTLGPVSGWF